MKMDPANHTTRTYLTSAQRDVLVEFCSWAADRQGCTPDELGLPLAVVGRWLYYTDPAAAAQELDEVRISWVDTDGMWKSFATLMWKITNPEAYAAEQEAKKQRHEARRVAQQAEAKIAGRPATEDLPAWVYDNGGRWDAGFKGYARDCVVRALAIVTGAPYSDLYDQLSDTAKSAGQQTARNGMYPSTYRPVYEAHGLTYTRCDDHKQRLDRELVESMPTGAIIHLSGHVVAVVDGELRDIGDCAGKKVKGWFLPQ